jgi:hypothetical protein
LVQKVVDINPYLMIAWSGHQVAASVVVKELRELCAGKPVRNAVVRDYLASLGNQQDRMLADLSVIGLQVDHEGVPQAFGRHVMQMHGLPDGTDALYAGTGGDHFAATIRGQDRALARIEGPPWFVAMSRAHAIQGSCLLREMWSPPSKADGTENPLTCFYGGGYELAMTDEAEGAQRVVRKIGGTVLAFWEARIEQSGRVNVIPPSLFIKRAYWGRNLVLRWGRTAAWRRGRSTLIADASQECAVVPPVDEYGPPVILDRDLWPRFSAASEGHAILVTSPSGRRKIMGWLGHNPSVLRRAFSFTDLPSGEVQVIVDTDAPIFVRQYVEQMRSVGALESVAHVGECR